MKSLDEPDPPIAPALNGPAIRVAHEIADWCEAKRKEASAAADSQIRVVWMLLLGGLILLLVLPRVIQEIDYAWRKSSLPPQILLTADETITQLESNRKEMQSEVEAATEQRDTLKKDAAAVEDELERIKSDNRWILTQPFSAWRVVTPEGFDNRYDLSDVVRLGDGTLVAVGNMSDDKSVSPVILKSVDGLAWRVDPPRSLTPGPGTASSETLSGLLDEALVSGFNSVADASPEGLVAILNTNYGPAIVSSENALDWRLVWQGEAFDPSRQLFDIAIGSTGRLFAAGHSIALGSRAQVLLQTAQGRWDLSENNSSFTPVDGTLSSILPLPEGAVMVAGTETTQDGQEYLTTLVTEDGSNWTRRRPQIDDADVPGQAFALVRTKEGDLLLGYHASGGSGVIRSRTGRSWTKLEFDGADLNGGEAFTSMTTTEDGMILIAASKALRSGSELVLLSSADGSTWHQTRYETFGNSFSPSINAMTTAPDGRVVAVGEGLIMTSVTPAEAEMLAEGFGGTLSASMADVILPAGSAVMAMATKRNIDKLSQLADQQTLQQDFLRASEASYGRQNQALEKVGALTTELEKTLRASEPFRQLAQTATRLAVIGLLIYLVQIVVNRYRYLQRLAGFYQARAQALRLFAASPDASLLQGVSLADLTAMLSPDAIGFDKSAEPPTSQMVSLLQAGLRKA